MKLFMIYIGGDIDGSNVELHDVRFCIGDTIEDCYDDLRRQWWGNPDSLHLDCWGVLEHADGHDITLTKDTPDEAADKLYFVNLGGYSNTEFTELHKNMVVVAPTDSKAKVHALKTVQDWNSPHRDYQFDIEKAVCITDTVQSHGYHIHLTPSVTEKPFDFACRYVPIALK